MGFINIMRTGMEGFRGSFGFASEDVKKYPLLKEEPKE